MNAKFAFVLAIAVIAGLAGCDRKAEMAKATRNEAAAKQDAVVADLEKKEVAEDQDRTAIQSSNGSPTVGQPAPEITLEATFNAPSPSEVTLAELRGKVVVLDYWATW